MTQKQQNQAREKELREQAILMFSKKAVVFDLDGTLTKSKTHLDKERSFLLCGLLEKKTAAVMGGGSYKQFKSQFLDYLNCAGERLKNLFILPVSGGSMYKYENGGWKLVYENNLEENEKDIIRSAFKNAFHDIDYIEPKKTYGEVVEDRASQMTFSALGQEAPLFEKEKWNKNSDIRPLLKTALEKHLSDFNVRLAGLTSIDITKKGIDKAYGLARLAELLSLSKKDIIYIGDALYEGGNDYAVKLYGADVFQIKDEEETKEIIRLLTNILTNI